MTAKIVTPVAIRGQTVKIASGQQPVTVAYSLVDQICSPGEAIDFSLEMSVPNSQLFANGGSASNLKRYVCWFVQWGYGGVQFTRAFIANSARMNVSGDFVRVSAQIVTYLEQGNGNIIPAAAGDNVSTNVSAAAVPAVDGQTKWSTMISPLVTANTAAVFFSAPVLQNNVGSIAPAPNGVLWRIWGVNATTGTGVDYIQLFDQVSTWNSNTGPASGTDIPDIIAGAVNQGGNSFSLDLSLSGWSFNFGVWLGASSTPALYTADASQNIVFQGEFLLN